MMNYTCNCLINNMCKFLLFLLIKREDINDICLCNDSFKVSLS